MKRGDKVNIVDEKGIFIIKEIKGKEVILIDEYGFEVIYLTKQIIPYRYLKEADILSPKVMKEEDETSKVNKHLVTNKEDSREIDLHIGYWVDSLKEIRPHQMLQKQIDIASSEISKAKKDRIKKLILIHGKGKGILKEKIYQLLQSIEGIEYFEADIIKYRFGAVEIRFK